MDVDTSVAVLPRHGWHDDHVLAAGVLPCHGMMGRDKQETMRQILDRRYVGGEFRKEQYDEMKRNLV